MRSRVTVLLVALAMVASSAAVVRALPCDDLATVRGSCCCDSDADLADDLPASVEAACCCSVDTAPATPPAPEAITEIFDAHTSVLAVPARVELMVTGPPHAVVVTPVRARAPPPRASLLAQRTSFVC